MDQGQKRLLLLVILLFWRSADGFKGGAYFNAHNQCSQPFDTISPHAAQSSMSEARVTGTSAVEEMGSSLFPNRPLERGSKLNLYQFVKGGPSISQSASLAQTAPSSSVSASLPLPVDAQPSSSLTSSGSTLQGAASGLSLQTQYVASGSGPVVSTQGKRSSYPAKLVSSQSTGDQSSPSLSSSSQGSSGMLLASGSSLAGLSPLNLSSKSPETSSQLLPLPLVGSSQSTSGQSSPSVSPSTQSRSGTPLATSSHVPVQGGSSSSLYRKPQGTLGQYAPASPTKYVSVPMSSPQAIYSPTTSSGSSYRVVSQVASPSQTGASGQFTSRGGKYFSGLLPQSQATSSQYALGYSKPISSPQSTSSQSASVLSFRKQYTSASQGSSGAQFGASTGFASQGMSSSYSGSVQSQGTTSQFAPGSQSPYDGLYCKCALSPQGVDRQSTIQSSRKRFTSSYGTQSGSSTPFTLQGRITYDGSPQPQGTASQFAPVPQSSPSVLSPSQGAASQSTAVQSSRKQFTSSYGTQSGSSTPFTLQGSSAYGGSPQDAASQFAPGSKSPYASVLLSSPQSGPSTTVRGPLKQLPSTYAGSSGTQVGSSSRFTLQGSSAYGGSSQTQEAASRFVPGSSSPYASVSLSSPQGVASQSSQAHKGYSVSQSQKSQRWQPSATRWGQIIRPSDAAPSQGSSSQSSPMQFSSLSSAAGSPSRDSGQFVSAQSGGTSYGGSFRSQSHSTKYTPGSQLYDPSVASQGTSSASASEVLSS